MKHELKIVGGWKCEFNLDLHGTVVNLQGISSELRVTWWPGKISGKTMQHTTQLVMTMMSHGCDRDVQTFGGTLYMYSR